MPVAALTFPGDDRPRALTHRWRELSISDPDGVVTAQSRGDSHSAPFATGSVELPPLDFWYALRPRDAEGSAALRAADRDTVAALLKEAAAAEKLTDLPGLVGAALPQVTAPELVGGIIEVLRFTLTQQKDLDAIAARLHQDPTPAEQREQGPSDRLLADGLNGLIGSGYYRWGSDGDCAHHILSELGAACARTDATAVPGRLHFDAPALPPYTFSWTPLLDQPAAVAYRAVAASATDEQRAALVTLLGAVDALGLASAEGSAPRWRRVLLHLDRPHLTAPDGVERNSYHRSMLPLDGGAVLMFTEHSESVPYGQEYGALFHDPTGRFTVPGPYTARGDAPLGDRVRGAGWLTAFLGAAAEHGPVPFRPEDAEEFARLTGVSGALARLVLAGLPYIDNHERNFLPAELRTVLGVKAADAAYARDELRNLDADVRRAVVAALLPADPARLWSEGPDVAAAAEVWNRRVGRRTPVPDWLATEAARAVGGVWPAHRALAALLDPAASRELSVDVAWTVKGDHVEPREPATGLFTAPVLTGTVAMAAWLAHRLPAGDPVRAALPPVLTRTAPGDRALHQPPRLPEGGRHPDRDRRGLRALRRGRHGHPRRPAQARTAPGAARLHRLRPVHAGAARRRPAALRRGDGPADRPRPALRRAARRPRSPGGGNGRQGRHLVAAGPDPLGSRTGGGGERRVRSGRRRGRPVPRGARHARPDRPQHRAVDGLEAGPPQGCPRRTGRHRSGRRGRPEPGRTHAVPAGRVERDVLPGAAGGAVEASDVRPHRGRTAAAGRPGAGRTGRGALSPGLAAGPRGRRTALRGTQGQAHPRPPPLTSPGPVRRGAPPPRVRRAPDHLSVPSTHHPATSTHHPATSTHHQATSTRTQHTFRGP